MMDDIQLEDYHLFDFNWYFADYYNRLCAVASGGGILPKFLANEKSNNNKFHEIVMNLEERFFTKRNEKLMDSIVDFDSVQDIEQYFGDFESLAKKGFYVYDKVDINNPDDLHYVLAVYPVYDPQVDSMPINSKDLKLILKLKCNIIFRRKTEFYDINFSIRNLVNLIDSKCR